MEPLRLSVQNEPRGKRKPNAGQRAFSIPAALERADAILAGPCAGHLPRVPGRGVLLHRFALPLELVQPTNRTRGAQAWALASLKNKVFRMMWVQHPFVCADPVKGRPQVRCIRFSIKEPDALNDGFKMAVDCLTRPKPPKRIGGRKKLGLAILHDDAPAFVDVVAWWERAPQGYGMGLLEVWSGDRR